MINRIPQRLGPLSIEVKKRPAKRARLEKNKADQRRPQELKEADITRSDNETTKNVILVSIAALYGGLRFSSKMKFLSYRHY